MWHRKMVMTRSCPFWMDITIIAEKVDVESSWRYYWWHVWGSWRVSCLCFRIGPASPNRTRIPSHHHPSMCLVNRKWSSPRILPIPSPNAPSLYWLCATVRRMDHCHRMMMLFRRRKRVVLLCPINIVVGWDFNERNGWRRNSVRDGLHRTNYGP